MDAGLKREEVRKIKDVPKESWDMLSRSRIFFGHQSVGKNIVDGLNDVMKEHPEIRLRIIPAESAPRDGSAFMAHTNIGRNEDPRSKCDDFTRWLQESLADTVDISVMKFCFVDVDRHTDLNVVMRDLEAMLESLRQRYPKMRIVVSTVPLTRNMGGIQYKVKKALGLDIPAESNNEARNRINRMIRDKFSGRYTLFEIDKAEATREDGSMSFFVRGGETFLAMDPRWTDDGAHLNPAGRKWVAEQLLITLAEAGEKGGPSGKAK